RYNGAGGARPSPPLRSDPDRVHGAGSTGLRSRSPRTCTDGRTRAVRTGAETGVGLRTRRGTPMRHPSRLRSALRLATPACLAAGPPERVPDRPVPLAVRGGRCTFVLPAGSPADKYVLVVGSLSRARGTHHVSVRTEATDDAVSLPLASDDPGPAWRRYIGEL